MITKNIPERIIAATQAGGLAYVVASGGIKSSFIANVGNYTKGFVIGGVFTLIYVGVDYGWDKIGALKSAKR